MEDKALKVAKPLPLTSSGLHRVLKTQRTIIDQVEDIYLAVYDSENGELFRSYLSAVYDQEAVTGKKFIDDVRALDMVLEYAREHKLPVAKEMESVVLTALRRVLRRYGNSRLQRLANAD